MNTNKNSKIKKANKAIHNMKFTNSFDALKAAENKADTNISNMKPTNNSFS